MPNFLEGRVENRPKMRKGPAPLGLEGKFLRFVPGTLECPLYTFLMPNLPLLSQTFSTKLKKTVLLDQFYTVPSTFRLSPQRYGLSSLFYYITLSDLVLTWISQNFVFIVYANQKLFRKNLWGRLGPISPWYPKG